MDLEFKHRLNLKIPTYLYGAGITASKVYSYLSGKGHNISGFIVDNKTNNLNSSIDIIDFTDLGNQPINLILSFVPTIETVKDIEKKVLTINNSINFIAHDFSFLSFGLFPKNYIKTKKFRFVSRQLNDEISRETLKGYLKSRNTGNFSECEKYFDSNQYFPKDIIELDKNETFIDCGVYDGETIKEFLKLTNNSFDKILGFEPDHDNFKKSQYNLNHLSPSKYQLCNVGTWHSKNVLKFSTTAERISGIDPNGEIEIAVDKIDNYSQYFQRVTFIKMDVEGAELNSLHGAIETILKYRPKLAICLYHKPQDVFDILNWINSLDLDYKFYIRLHTRFSQELVLYCI